MRILSFAELLLQTEEERALLDKLIKSVNDQLTTGWQELEKESEWWDAIIYAEVRGIPIQIEEKSTRVMAAFRYHLRDAGWFICPYDDDSICLKRVSARDST